MAKTTDHNQWVIDAVERFECQLVAYARRLVGSEESARDVVQHVFLKLCDQDKLTIGNHLPQWLFKACRNRAIDELRRRTRSEQVHNEWTEHQQTNGHPAGHADSPVDQVSEQEIFQLVQQLIACLPEEQRESIDLWSHGFRFREIAQITGRNETTIRVQVFRGLKKLREHQSVRRWSGAHVDHFNVSNLVSDNSIGNSRFGASHEVQKKSSRSK